MASPEENAQKAPGRQPPPRPAGVLGIRVEALAWEPRDLTSGDGDPPVCLSSVSWDVI